MLTRIVRFLKDHEGYLSGEEISRSLHISRAAIWKYMDQLRDVGYEIEAFPHRGYRLLSAPDLLLPSEVQYGLETRQFGSQIHHFESIHSTMDEAFRLGLEGAPEGTVVVAETQTKGRGRMGRSWSSPKSKGIYFSLIIRPLLPPSQAAMITLASAIALSEAIEIVSPQLKTGIKWPNDILAGKKKLCGILTELRAETDRVQFVVIGVGVNVNNTSSQLLPEATSLRVETGGVCDRVRLFQAILRQMEKRYAAFLKQGPLAVVADWKARSATLGCKVRFLDRGESVVGVAEDLANDGGLWVRLSDGRRIKRVAGDIFL
ncbi:MAG: biotin--[acetyl-CoA-carboxylase] ligase [Candidatus Omnitrophica bacterium]|nr:biotin--[acetyl-CoA-carboxylase] ligase [Candidatus Omnitrophota bacterium]